MFTYTLHSTRCPMISSVCHTYGKEKDRDPIVDSKDSKWSLCTKSRLFWPLLNGTRDSEGHFGAKKVLYENPHHRATTGLNINILFSSHFNPAVREQLEILTNVITLQVHCFTIRIPIRIHAREGVSHFRPWSL